MTDHTDGDAFRIAGILHKNAESDEVELVMRTLDDIVTGRRASRGVVLVACAQILAHCIVDAPEIISSDIKNGIDALIDLYVNKIRSQTSQVN